MVKRNEFIPGLKNIISYDFNKNNIPIKIPNNSL